MMTTPLQLTALYFNIPVTYLYDSSSECRQLIYTIHYDYKKFTRLIVTARIVRNIRRTLHTATIRKIY